MLQSELLKIKEEILSVSGVNPLRCMQCGKCSGTCPNYDEMEYHPNQFVRMVETAELEPLLASTSLYKCLSCMACIERCPRQVEPARLVEAVRLVVERQRGPQHLEAEDIPSRLDGDMPQQAVVSAFRKYRK
ncbi:MAG: 4Fe-4S dicluster domain-containing protein [Treponemataceae bacterium]|nr:4Fe-4S dicluster domain-containing protein [Treponemataceae bacterium]